MKQIALCAVMLLTLTSCEPQTAADEYRFERAEYTATDLRIRYVEYSSLSALQTELRRRGIRSDPTKPRQAFGVINPARPGVCEIHLVDPAVSYRPEWPGHEFIHCVKGRFHPSQP